MTIALFWRPFESKFIKLEATREQYQRYIESTFKEDNERVLKDLILKCLDNNLTFRDLRLTVDDIVNN